MHLPRKLKFTKEGTRFVILCIGIGIAAINTGLNLLFLILAMMLSSIIISGILSEISLRKISVKRFHSSRGHAGDELTIKFTIENLKMFLPSFSLIIKDKSFEDLSAYITKINANQKITFPCKKIFLNRGLFELKEILILTRFPFGLFEKSSKILCQSKIIIYPRIKQINTETISLPKHFLQSPFNNLAIKNSDEIFHGLREYRLGDNPKRIHWKSTARFLKPMIKEFEKHQESNISILLDTFLVENNDQKQKEFLESAISLCASLANFFISKNYNIFFSAYTPQFTKISFAKGRDQLYRILETLALIKPNSSKNFSFLLDELSESQITGYVIAILLNVNQGKNKISAKINLPGTLLHTINIREHSVFNYFKIHQTA